MSGIFFYDGEFEQKELGAACRRKRKERKEWTDAI